MIKTSLTFQSSAARSRGIEIQPSTLDRSRNLRAAKSRARSCDYDAAAGLYIRKGSRLHYMGFPRASLAVRYANEELTPTQLLGCTMEIDDDRFLGSDVQALYHSADYPLSHDKVVDE